MSLGSFRALFVRQVREQGLLAIQRNLNQEQNMVLWPLLLVLYQLQTCWWYRLSSSRSLLKMLKYQSLGAAPGAGLQQFRSLWAWQFSQISALSTYLTHVSSVKRKQRDLPNLGNTDQSQFLLYLEVLMFLIYFAFLSNVIPSYYCNSIFLHLISI